MQVLALRLVHAPIKVALKHDALVFPGKHLGMFPDRYVIAGSIDYRIMTTTPEQRLARAEELIELGRQNLPLLEAQDRTEAARTIDTDTSREDEGETGRQEFGAGASSQPD